MILYTCLCFIYLFISSFSLPFSLYMCLVLFLPSLFLSESLPDCISLTQTKQKMFLSVLYVLGNDDVISLQYSRVPERTRKQISSNKLFIAKQRVKFEWLGSTWFPASWKKSSKQQSDFKTTLINPVEDSGALQWCSSIWQICSRSPHMFK